MNKGSITETALELALQRGDRHQVLRRTRFDVRLGRDERSIERTVELQRVVIRDTRAAALAREAELLELNGGAKDDEDRPGSAGVDSDRIIAGNPDEVAEQLKPYVDAGYRHLICGFPPPYDDETMRRLATEVRPQLEAMVG